MTLLPSISIIIPTLNRPKLVKRCIKSIHDQSFKGKINCVVVDSSFDDSTKKVVLDFNKVNKNFNLKYLKNDSSINPIDNYVFAIDSLSSDYSKFLNDDDWLEEEFLVECLNIFSLTSVDCVASNISLHKEFTKNKEIITGYYKYEEGSVTKERVIDAFLGLDNMIPVTPTASLYKTEKLKESFYSSLKHFECTRYLFGFDFHMNYYHVFNGGGTYLMEKSLANAWAGDDSMTLNVKMAKISYCYFYSLVKLIEISNFHITNKQKKLVEHKIAVIKLKSLINSEYKKIILPTEYKFKLIFTKLLSDLIKKIYIKLIYKFIKN